jgi:hypothetical protein
MLALQRPVRSGYAVAAQRKEMENPPLEAGSPSSSYFDPTIEQR